MTNFLENISLFPMIMTLGYYQLGLWLRKKFNHPIVNPLLIAVVLTVASVLLTGFSNEVYQQGTANLTWLLTPATVCLAVPLHEQIMLLKKNLTAIALGVLAGTFTSLIVIFVMCLMFRLNDSITISLLPKSVTSAMSMALSEQNGGISTLTAAVTIVTGVQGALMGSALCKLFKITDPIAQGVAFGTASHVVGTSKATEMGQLQGAVSSLSLALSGIMTAILLPFVVMLV